jgi:hypothetical protein
MVQQYEHVPIKYPSAINNVMCLPSHFKFFSNFQPYFQCGKPREEHVSSVILRILNYSGAQSFNRALALSTKEEKEQQRQGRKHGFH